MTKVLALLSIIALAAAAPILAEDAGVVHSASGSGQAHFFDPFRTFEFNAVERSDGSVSGQVQLQARSTPDRHDTRGVHVEVDCLNVIGNLAIVSGIITKSSADPGSPGALGNVAVFAVEDNGEGASAAPDRITLLFTFIPEIFPPGTPLCELLGPADAAPLLMPIEHGNVQVR